MTEEGDPMTDTTDLEAAAREAAPGPHLGYDPRHPHERDAGVPPQLDRDGRCIVCGYVVQEVREARAALTERVRRLEALTEYAVHMARRGLRCPTDDGRCWCGFEDAQRAALEHTR